MSFGKGSTSTTQTTGPNPAAGAAYNSLLDRAGNVANTPYNPYGGELVAGVNQQQNLGIGGINANANFAQPFIGQAAQYANNAAQPITGQQIANYQSPYTQQVVNATQAQFANQNAQQQSALTGNAAAQGALGGDRVGVAQGILGGQQALAQAPVIAGLYNSGFQNAEQFALTQQQAQGNAAYSLGNLGVAGQQAALSGAGAQVGAGSLQQQTQQAEDAARLQQFYQQQAYPFQTTQWLAGIDTGVGSQLGGTSTTTPPPPNPWNTALGLGLSAASMFARDGGRIHRDAGGGLGGAPYGGASGWVPTINVTGGSGAPKPPTAPGQQSAFNLNSGMAAAKGAKSLWDKYGPQDGPLDIGGAGLAPDPTGTMEAIGSSPELGFGFGGLYRNGGAVQHFEDGGLALAGFGTGSVLPFEDRFAPATDAIRAGVFDPQGANATAFADQSASDMPHSVATIPVRKPTSIGDAELPPEITAGTSHPVSDDGDTAVTAYSPTGAQGLAAAPGVPADEGHGAPASGGLLSRFGVNLDPDLRRSLLSAGFGLMASKSPFLGQAIGEAGQAGLNTYSGIQTEKRQAKKTEADIQHGKDQLAQAAKLAQDRLTQTDKQFQADLGLKRQAADRAEAAQVFAREKYDVPQGFRKTAEGGLEPIPGGPHDPATVRNEASAKRLPGMDDSALEKMVDAYQAGFTGVLSNVGRGTQGADNINRFWNILGQRMAASGASGNELAAAKANFTAQSAAAVTAAKREANVSASVEEAKQTFPLALEASAKVPRGQFVPWNKLTQMVASNLSSPEQRTFYVANQGVITAYAQAMARTGVATVDSRHAAEELLRTADSPETYAQVLAQMSKEMHAAEVAPEIVRQKVLDRIRGGSGAGPTSAVAPAALAVTPGAHVGEERQFKQGVGVWNGTAWVPKGTP